MKRRFVILVFTFVLFILFGKTGKAEAATIVSGQSGTCTWTIDSDYTLTFSAGTLEDWDYHTVDWYEYAPKIRSVRTTGKVVVLSGNGMFSNFSSLESLNLSSFDTSQVRDMSSMFGNCSSLTSLDVSCLNTSNATTMNSMFQDCTSITSINMSGWNTKNVKDMSYMFRGCEKLPSINVSGFNTSNVTTMQAMFHCCDSLTSLDLSGFDTGNVTDMSYMINCTKLTSVNLSGFNTKKVTTMDVMFQGCWSLASLDLSCFNTGSVKDMTNMFWGCEALKRLRVGTWTYASITNDSKKPVFPIIMRDAATGLDYDANEIIPEVSNRIYKTVSPENREFKYYKTKGLYLRQKGFKDFNETRDMLNQHMNEQQSGPIPGIIDTIINDGSAISSSKKYVPQGLCKFGSYYLVTSYEKSDNAKHSAIYVLDSTWNLVTTVTVGNYKYHNGGIAYDSRGDVLWFCGNTRSSYEGKPYVFGMQGSKLRNAIESGSECVHLSSFGTGSVYINNTPSCLDYHNGRLWVGTFNSSGSSDIIGYKTIGDSLYKDNRVSITGVGGYLNGFTMSSDNELYASYSSGRGKMCFSRITRYQMSGSFTSGSRIKLSDKRTINVPRMNEEILLDDSKLYILYESGATYYNDACIRTDRVTSLPTSLWDSRTYLHSADAQVVLFGNDIVADEIRLGDTKTISFDYQSYGETEGINETEKIFSFTPETDGMYTFSINHLTGYGDGSTFVTAEITDGDNYLGYACTAEYNYSEDDEADPFIAYDNAACTLFLTKSRTYTVTCSADSMIPFDFDSYEAEESDCSYSGTYTLTLSGSDVTVDDYSTDVNDGETVPMMTKEGETSIFRFVPNESGTYRVQCESSGSLGDMIILKNMTEEIPFNGEYCELEADQNYYFISSLNESDGVSSECEISMTITKYDLSEIAAGETVPVSGDTILNHIALESRKHVVRVTGGAVFNITVYDENEQMIAMGDENVIFEAIANAPYRIECTGCEGDVHLSIEPYQPEPISLNEAEISNIKNKTYTGKSLTQSPVVIYDYETLKEGTDYVLSYKNNVNAGTATVLITGKGDYADTVTKTFTIVPASIAKASVSGIKTKTYTGRALSQKPVLKLGKKTLAEGTDYTVSYQNNKAVGKAVMVMKGKGNHTGAVRKTFIILPKKTSLQKLTAGTETFKATWTKLKPAAASGYQIQYSLKKNFKSGKKTVTIKGYKNNTRIIKKLKVKKRYYVRIRTYKKVGKVTYYSGWSKTQSVRTK